MVAGALVAAAVALSAGLAREEPGKERAVIPTGEHSDMGLPVIETPGAAMGWVAASGIEVVGASWALGQVPLDVAVRPHWQLVNTGNEPVTIGEPHAEVREGCCPGPFALDSRAIAPGDAVTLSFELAMHPGMDGWHDIAVHVPLLAGDTHDVLTLEVTGQFG